MSDRPLLLRRLLILACAAVYLLSAGRAFQAVSGARHGRDFATYYYATQVALDGGDPYDKRALAARARDDGSRGTVHPYFYPPPFLLTMLWVAPFSLHGAYLAWFFLNQGLLAATLLALRRWLAAPWLLLAAVAALYSPVVDNLKMGQANLLVGLLAVLGLWRGSGLLVGAAAMAKMAPALYLLHWGARLRARPVLVAMGAALGLSALALPLVGLDLQWRFYTDVLPGFASGDYNGLSVPITLPANHSFADLFNQLWPGPDDHHLSAAAARASKVLTLTLLTALVWVSARSRDALSEANALGALTVLMVLTPVYAYEHHLATLILPLVAGAVALIQGRLGRRWWGIWGLGFFLGGWPLFVLRDVQRVLPALHWPLQESKPLGLVLTAAVCVAAALAEVSTSRPPGPTRGR